MRKKNGCQPVCETSSAPAQSTSVNRSQSAASSLLASVSTLNLASLNTTLVSAQTGSFSSMSTYTMDAVQIGGFTLKGPMDADGNIISDAILNNCPIGVDIAVGATFVNLITSGTHAWLGPTFNSAYDNVHGVLQVANALTVGSMSLISAPLLALGTTLAPSTGSTGSTVTWSTGSIWTQPDPLTFLVPRITLPTVTYQRWWTYRDMLEDSGIWTSGPVAFSALGTPQFGWQRRAEAGVTWISLDVTEDARAEGDRGSTFQSLTVSFSSTLPFTLSCYWVLTDLTRNVDTEIRLSGSAIGQGYQYVSYTGLVPKRNLNVQQTVRLKLETDAQTVVTMFGCTVTWQRLGW